MTTATTIPLRALADALEAGLSLRDPAVSRMFPSDKRAAIARALDENDGEWSRALRAVDLVDDAGAAILVAGERGGFFPNALRMVADDAAAAGARRRRSLAAIAYPAFLVVTASVILPLPTIFTKGASAYLAAAAPGVLVTTAILVVAFVIVPRLAPSARARITALLAHVPIYGAVVVDNARASVLDVLGRLIACGVPLTSALSASVAAGGLSSWSADGRTAAAAGGALGGALADTLKDRGVIDDAQQARIAIAEKTGTLDKALPGLAKEARERAQRRFIGVSVALGVACFMIVAASIAVSVVGGAQGYFDQIDAATKE